MRAAGLLLLLAIACGKDAPTDERAARGRTAIDQLRTFADRICACPDAPCRVKLHAESLAITEQLDQTRFEAEQVEQLAKDEARIAECMRR
ncbi:MAG TPA: hypothetical protein VIV11_25955 [Kofleriaceae bacterium]